MGLDSGSGTPLHYSFTPPLRPEPVLRSLARGVRRWVRACAPHAIVLLYHRVAELESDAQWLAVTPERFAAQMDLLRSRYRVVSLRELTHCLREERVPRNAVVVTFDDGYADNLHNAKPILKRYGIPATVFVCTSGIQGRREFWWDELERLLLETPRLPDTLSLVLHGREYRWDTSAEGVQAGTDGGAAGKAGFRSHDSRLTTHDSQVPTGCRWNVTIDECLTPRRKAYRELAPLIRNLSYEDRQAVLDEVSRWAGVEREVRPSHRCMTAQELRELADDGLVEVGAHTMTHSVLSHQDAAEQQRELCGSKLMLEEILERPVESFSYPFGGREDYTPETVVLAQQSGFLCACSNFPEWVTPRTSPFQIPRYLVRDWPVDEFTHLLEGWFSSFHQQ